VRSQHLYSSNLTVWPRLPDDGNPDLPRHLPYHALETWYEDVRALVELTIPIELD